VVAGAVAAEVVAAEVVAVADGVGPAEVGEAFGRSQERRGLGTNSPGRPKDNRPNLNSRAVSCLMPNRRGH
jgi:hypothetical protein